jgi:cell division transport system permease protein
MGNFLRYAFRETATNLWRNWLMTMAAVLTVWISLGLVGSALYLKQGAAQASASWEKQTEVIVWLQPTASSQIATVTHELAANPYVEQPCTFWSRLEDYYEARKELGTEAQSLTPTTTPASFRCTPVQLSDAALVVSEFKGQPGILTVSSPQGAIHAIENAVWWLQVVFVTIALILLLSASVLILNTIRMAIFARRREVSVMKLVGATNWFIRIPFIIEGLVQGLVGGLLASLTVVGIHVFVDAVSNPANPQSLGAEMRLSDWNVFMTDVVVVVLGCLIGALGSAFAVRRFLDV